jgi:hypothetical protein
MARDLAPEHLLAEVMASVDEKQRRYCWRWRPFPNVSLQLHHVSGLADVTDLEPSMALLAHRGHRRSQRLAPSAGAWVGDRLRQTKT